LASIKKHRDLLGLEGWDIIVSFEEVEGNMCMQTSAEPEYYKVSIDVDLRGLNDSDIDLYVRHELLHAVLWMYTHLAENLAGRKNRKLIRGMEERLVTDLERMPFWEILYKARRK
jgi:hypothetical protein